MGSFFKPCALVPVYNHHQVLAHTLDNIRKTGLPVILVDDGSAEVTRKVMQALAAMDNSIYLIVRPANGGKGAAVKTGLREAAALGYSHALQIDADGQHNSADIPRFLAAAEAQPGALIAGIPEYDASVPTGRFYARYLTHVWVWINTISLHIKDSMCGFRVYPVKTSCQLLMDEAMGDRMDFDTEFIVRWHWRQWPLVQLSTRVIYPEHGISHFLVWRDNKLISWMHTRLFFGMLRRLPRLLIRKLRTSS